MEPIQQQKPRPTAQQILSRVGFEFTSNNYKLGSGHYSKVYKGYYKDAKRNFAIKVTDMEQVSPDYKEKFMPREIRIWNQLDHRNHVYLYKDFEMDGYHFAIMDLVSGGDMLSHVQKNGPLKEDASREWMLQLIDAVTYIHRKGIAHRDLKLENMLLSGDKKVLKIADYGFSKQSRDLASTFCGSKTYSAPEILRGVDYDTFKADIWSMGVIAFILVTKIMPFREDLDSKVLTDSQRKRRYKYSSKLGLSQDCKDSIDCLLTYDASQRPSIYGCAHLRWFKSSDGTGSSKHHCNGHGGNNGSSHKSNHG